MTPQGQRALQRGLQIAGGAIAAGLGWAAGHVLFNAAEEAGEVESGAKSQAEYDRHVGNVEKAEGELEALKERLGEATGPGARRPIQEAIRRLERDIKGHEKEIRQKWPHGRPEQ